MFPKAGLSDYPLAGVSTDPATPKGPVRGGDPAPFR